MSLRELPARPNLDHLKNQARLLLEQGTASDPSALARFAAFGVHAAQPKLADALHVIAREYGFDTWPALKLHLELNSEDPLDALAAALKAQHAGHVHELLAKHPSLRARINQPLPKLSFDQPALFAAVEARNRELVDTLLDAGADPNQRTGWWAGGFGVLDLADHQFAEYLLSRGAKLDVHSAARLGKLDQVRDMLRADPSLVRARGGDGQLPLHFASTVEIAELLLDHGADIDARDIDHESTAAQYMASIAEKREGNQHYRHDVARFLLSRGAQADILMASALGDIAAVERILNHDPETIRITATERHFPKRDPRSGGSIYIFGFGITSSPHLLARHFGHPAVFDLLMQRSAPWLRLVQAAEIHDESLVHKILEEHSTVIARLTPGAGRRLVGVALRNNTHAIQLLLRSGWPAAVLLENRQTPLHYAAWHGNLTMVQSLLSHAAPVNVFETEHGGSPLGWALHGSLNSWHRASGDYPAVVQALLASGATIPAPDRPLEATEDVLAVIKGAVARNATR